MYKWLWTFWHNRWFFLSHKNLESQEFGCGISTYSSWNENSIISIWFGVGIMLKKYPSKYGFLFRITQKCIRMECVTIHSTRLIKALVTWGTRNAPWTILARIDSFYHINYNVVLVVGKGSSSLRLEVWKTLPFVEDVSVSGTDQIVSISGLSWVWLSFQRFELKLMLEVKGLKDISCNN